MMKIDEMTSRRMNTLFGHLADHSMVDSPNGPHATAMRTLGAKTELGEQDIADVIGRAGGQIAVHGALLEQARERTRIGGILTGLSLGSAEQDTLVPQVDGVLPPDPAFHPEYAATVAAADLLVLLQLQLAGASPEA